MPQDTTTQVADIGDANTVIAETGEVAHSGNIPDRVGMTLAVTEAQWNSVGSALSNASRKRGIGFTTDCMIGDRRIEVGYHVNVKEDNAKRKGKKLRDKHTFVINATTGEGNLSVIEVVLGRCHADGQKEHSICVKGIARELLKGQSICPAETKTKAGGQGPSLTVAWPFAVALTLCKASGLNCRAYRALLELVLAGVQKPRSEKVQAAYDDFLGPVSHAVAKIEKDRGVSRERAVSELVNDLGHFCCSELVEFLPVVEDGIEAWATQKGWGTETIARIRLSKDKFQHQFIREVERHRDFLPVCIVVANGNRHLAETLQRHLSAGKIDTFVIDELSSRNAVDRAMRQAKLYFVLGSTDDFTGHPMLAGALIKAWTRRKAIRVISTSSNAEWCQAWASMGLSKKELGSLNYDYKIDAGRSGTLDRIVANLTLPRIKSPA